MEEVVKVGLLAIFGVMAGLFLKDERGSLRIALGIALGLAVLTVGLRRLSGISTMLEELRAELGDSGSYLTILMKVLGITYICDFSAGICRDAGYGFLAGQLENLGKISVMFSGLSILFVLIEQIRFLL